MVGSKSFVPHALLAAAVSLLSGPVGAQQFDITRARLNDSTVFEPFVVTGSIPLQRALDDGTIDPSTRILVFEAGGSKLALITAQMAYHHAAQGDLAGEPWMVSF
jgi:hypothetical protein